jgi:hypothetical protein
MKNNRTFKIVITVALIMLIIFLSWYLIKDRKEANTNIIENANILNDATKGNDTSDDNEVVDSSTDKENETNFENDSGLTINQPQENQRVDSPINIEGEATGSWYFEANFGIKLVDRESGDLIAQSYVTALDNWMTEDSVPFNSTLEYELSEETEALLVLESANPSGLAENQMTYTVPLTLNASN